MDMFQCRTYSCDALKRCSSVTLTANGTAELAPVTTAAVLAHGRKGSMHGRVAVTKEEHKADGLMAQ